MGNLKFKHFRFLAYFIISILIILFAYLALFSKKEISVTIKDWFDVGIKDSVPASEEKNMADKEWKLVNVFPPRRVPIINMHSAQLFIRENGKIRYGNADEGRDEFLKLTGRKTDIKWECGDNYDYLYEVDYGKPMYVFKGDININAPTDSFFTVHTNECILFAKPEYDINDYSDNLFSKGTVVQATGIISFNKDGVTVNGIYYSPNSLEWIEVTDHKTGLRNGWVKRVDLGKGRRQASEEPIYYVDNDDTEEIEDGDVERWPINNPKRNPLANPDKQADKGNNDLINDTRINNDFRDVERAEIYCTYIINGELRGELIRNINEEIPIKGFDVEFVNETACIVAEISVDNNGIVDGGEIHFKKRVPKLDCIQENIQIENQLRKRILDMKFKKVTDLSKRRNRKGVIHFQIQRKEMTRNKSMTNQNIISTM